MTTPSGDSLDRSSESRPALRVAVLGATGLVGGEMLRLLEARRFPVAELLPLASRASARTVRFAGRDIPVQQVSREALEGADVVLASAGGDVSREWLPLAAAAGAVCIDNTSAFRMDPDVPLVVPEVNAHALHGIEIGGRDAGTRSAGKQGAERRGAERRGAIIANPNCSTIQLVVALAPLQQAFGLRRVLVSTYQSISGAGKGAVDSFREGSRKALLEGGAHGSDTGVPIFDVLPRIGEVGDDGTTSEELKMMRETPKILGVEVPVDVTCVRVPVQIGHAEAVVVETERPATPAEATRVLAAAPGIVLADTPEAGTPARVAGTHEVSVGRIRGTRSFESGLQFWVAADNLLKGAAWNAVQIAEELVQRVPASTASPSS